MLEPGKRGDGCVQDWGSFKQDLINATGLSKDALHIYLGVLLLVAFAFCLRRRINDPVAWFCVLAAVVANELADYVHYLGSDHRYVTFTLWDAATDVINSLAIPALICALRPDGRLGLGAPAAAGSRPISGRNDERGDSRSRGHFRSSADRRRSSASF